MGVALATEVFARLVGRHDEHRTRLFEVSETLLDTVEYGEWSEPVRFRFVKTEGALVEMEMQSLHAHYIDGSSA